MIELNQYYVTPRVEAYEVENESFIASSTSEIPKNPVSFGSGNGSDEGGGWTISKGNGNGEPVIEDIL